MTSVPESFDAVEVIAAKRDKHELGDAQIDWVVDAYTRGVVADEQMSALAMAILLNGMNRREIARWTQAMIDSGERMDFSTLSWKTADKHSWRRAASPCRSSRAAASATPAARSTSSSRSRAGAPHSPTRR